jgi:hypothetical protein
MKQTVVTALSFLLSLTAVHTATAQWLETEWPNMATVRNIMVEGNNIYVGATQSAGGISYSSDEGVTWQIRNKGLESKYGISVHSLAHIGPIVFAAVDTISDDDYVFCSLDTGKSWKHLWTTNSTINTLHVDGNVIYAGTSNGLYSSIDSGMHWNLVSDSMTSFRVLYPLGSTIFAITSGGFAVSSDSGKTFELANNGIEQTSVLCLAQVGSMIFIGTFLRDSIAVFRSADKGKDWTPMAGSFPQRQANAMIAIGDRLFIGFNNGEVHYCNYYLGEHWVNISTGLGRSSVMTFGATGKTLFNGTYAGGVWSRPLSDFGTSDVAEKKTLSGIQCYPNPTTGVLHVSSNSVIKQIEILNALGQRVRMISTESLYEPIDMEQLSSGIYIVKVQTEGGIVIRQIVKN